MDQGQTPSSPRPRGKSDTLGKEQERGRFVYVGTEIALVPSQPWVLGMGTHQKESRTTHGGKQNHQKGPQCPWCLLQPLSTAAASSPCQPALLPQPALLEPRGWEPAPRCLQGAKADLDRTPAPAIFWWGLHNRVNLR